MPLDNSQYISEFNLNNPVGNIDTVNMTPDFFREIKRTIKQSFPNINKQTLITSDELNNLKANMIRTGSTWDVNSSTIINVLGVDNPTAVQPRSYNDGRYLQRTNNLSDLSDRNVALVNLMNGISSGSTGFNALMAQTVNMVYPVGTVYINASNSANPRDFFGTGTWAAFAEGRVLVGAGTGTDSRNEARAFTRGSTGGEYRHLMTLQELVSHYHDTPVKFTYSGSSWIERREGSGGPFTGTGPSTNTGGSTPFNVVQPYTTVAIWVRTA